MKNHPVLSLHLIVLTGLALAAKVCAFEIRSVPATTVYESKTAAMDAKLGRINSSTFQLAPVLFQKERTKVAVRAETPGQREPRSDVNPPKTTPPPSSDRKEESLPAPRAQTGVDLLSKSGAKYVGDQLQFFSIDADRTISAEKPLWIYLYYTEGKAFRLTGHVWLGGRSDQLLFPGDLPDGFALFIREWDGMHRYGLTSRGADVKRRLHRGVKETDIVTVGEIKVPQLRKWIPFTIEVSWDKISFSFGDETIIIPGPLDTDGANKIVITPGTKLRNLRLEGFSAY